MSDRALLLVVDLHSSQTHRDETGELSATFEDVHCHMLEHLSFSWYRSPVVITMYRSTPGLPRQTCHIRRHLISNKELIIFHSASPVRPLDLLMT